MSAKPPRTSVKIVAYVTIQFICALEGAFILCRASRTTEALDVAGATMTAAVRAGIAAAK
jgi:hypothetical protein